MSERPFLEKAQKPDTAVAEVALEPALASYRDLAAGHMSSASTTSSRAP